MTRTKRTLLDSLAGWLCLPCLLVAAALYALVTWVPEAQFKRDLLIGAFVVAALGAALVLLPKGTATSKAVGATTMAVALTSVLCIWLW